MSGLEIAAGALILGGTLIGAKGQRDYGKASRKQANQAAANELAAAKFEANQANYLAGQAVATSHYEALEQRRSAALLASKALAGAAASGAGASDPTVVDIINGINSEGTYRSALAMYQGEETARNYRVAAQARLLGGTSYAAAKIAEGGAIDRASRMNMFSTLLGGAGSLFSMGANFGGGGGADLGSLDGAGTPASPGWIA